jgi:hypothetical protein
MRYALLDSGGTLLWHRELELQPPDPVGKGWRWVADPSPPPSPEPGVPQEVTLFQLRGALLAAGLLDAVDAFIAGLADPLAAMAWQYASTVARNSPLVLAAQAALALGEGDVDAIFTAGAAITV